MSYCKDTIIDSDIFKGKTFEYVWNTNSDYCVWLVHHGTCNQQDFIWWLLDKETLHFRENFGILLVTSGRHKGKTFLYVYENDPSYCKWVCDRKISNSSCNMETFRYYIESRYLNG